MEKVLVLVVEKDSALVAEAVAALQEAGYEVVEATDTADGLKKLYELNPDIIIASTDLPPVNGEEACRRIRQASYLPVVILGSQEELVKTLELGADAYIVKPASGREVVARVHSLLRREKKDEPPGGARLRPEHYQPGEEDTPPGLSPTECRLSNCLLSNEGRLLGYPQIITEVWGGKKVSVDTLHFYIRRLRRKMSNFNIFSMRGVGYGLSVSGQQAR
ncbi:MAG: response regulator transcription factor [Dehalococcoidales bacterium]|jgi:DNA-binding response OmpR family regulator